MSFHYTHKFLDSGLSYTAYKQQVQQSVSVPAADENAAKLSLRAQENLYFMNMYDQLYSVSDSCKSAILDAPDTIWVVIAEGWCTDAAFSLPIMAAIEKALPKKVKLRIFLRDSNPDLIDAHLTDGGRSIPKLIVLDANMEELAKWGPRPAPLHAKVKGWRNDGMSMNLVIPKMQIWYDNDLAVSFQQEMKMIFAAVREVHGELQD